MNIQQALDTVDQMMPNMMPRALKIAFLTEIEQMIHREVVMKHEHTEEQETMPAYTENTDPGTELIIPDPYSNLYYYYVMAKIDEQNLEWDKYNAHYAIFQNKYDTMNDWYTREHMPITAVPYYRL